MSEKEIDRYERETDNKAIDIDCDGIAVWFNPDDKEHLVIAGEKGKTKINYAMCLALADHLRGIAEMYLKEESA